MARKVFELEFRKQHAAEEELQLKREDERAARSAAASSSSPHTLLVNKKKIRVWALVFPNMEALETLQLGCYETMKEEARLSNERQENKGKGKGEGKDRNKGKEKGSDKGRGKGKRQLEKGGGNWPPAYQGDWGWGKGSSWGGNQDRWGTGAGKRVPLSGTAGEPRRKCAAT